MTLYDSFLNHQSKKLEQGSQEEADVESEFMVSLRGWTLTEIQ